MSWFFYQRIYKKLCGAFHHRISARQKLFVVGEFVVLPEVCAKPCSAGGPESPEWTIYRRGLSPQISVVMANPAACAVMDSCCARTILNQFRHHSQQRFMTLRQVRSFYRPVVHLRVDIDGVLAFPRRRHQMVPNTLQVRGLRAGTRR